MRRLLGLIAVLLYRSNNVLAASPGGENPPDLNQTINFPDPIGGKGFQEIVKNLVDFLTVIAVPLVAIMIIIGGIQLMTAGGNEAQISKGKETIKYAVIGFIVVVSANGIIAIIKDIFK